MPRINLFTSMEISASGLAAQRARMTAIARNIANASTTRTAEGGPYRRQEVLLETAPPTPAAGGAGLTPLVTDNQREVALAGGGEGSLAAATPGSAASIQPGGAGSAPMIPPAPIGDGTGGVRVAGIQEDDSEFQTVYDPGHPDADESGYVKMPNVNMINEMVDMMMAARAYEANLSALTTSRDMLLRTLTIGKQ